MASANRLDRVIEAIAPRYALKRAGARAALEMFRSYDAAGTSTRSKGWRRSQSGPNSTISRGLKQMRDATRHLVRNDPTASRIVQLWASTLIGPGIVSRSKTGIKKLDKKIDALFTEFCKTAAIEDGWTLDSLYVVATRSMVEGGDALWRRIHVRNRKIPIAFQLMEGDHLDSSKTQGEGKNRVVMGVEFDDRGQRVAYWLYPQHPGDNGMHAVSVRVPAAEITHLYRALRIGQVVGVPWLAPVVEKLYDLKDYQEAALVKAKTEACFAGFVESAEGHTTNIAQGSGNGTSASGRRLETIEPGMVGYLGPGQKMTFSNPTVSPHYEQFTLANKMDVAAGAGLTYSQVTGDPSRANFSSLKVGAGEVRREAEQLQYTLLLPRVADWVWLQFIEACLFAGHIQPRSGGYPVEHTPPVHEPIDAYDDLKTDILAVRAGGLSPQEFAAKRGYSFEDIIDDWTAAQKMMDANNLPFDIDPRKGQGAAPETPVAAKDKDKLDA